MVIIVAYYILGSIASLLLIISFCYFAINLYRIKKYERDINLQFTQKGNKIAKIKDNPNLSQDQKRRRVEKMEEQYRSKISNLERERRFILNKMPFIK